MLDTQKMLQYLAGQGGDAVSMTIAADSLAHAGMIPSDDRQPLNVDQCVNLLLGCCSPVPENAVEFVRDRLSLTIEGGNETLRGALIDSLSDDQLCPACVRILHQKPFVAIHGVDNDESVMEFGECFEAGGFRSERIISGGLMSLIAMKLNDLPDPSGRLGKGT